MLSARVCVCVCVGCCIYFSFILSSLFCRFDFRRTNVNDANLERMKPDDVPDIVSE